MLQSINTSISYIQTIYDYTIYYYYNNISNNNNTKKIVPPPSYAVAESSINVLFHMNKHHICLKMLKLHHLILCDGRYSGPSDCGPGWGESCDPLQKPGVSALQYQPCGDHLLEAVRR